MKAMLRDSFLRSPSCGACEKCAAEDYAACPALDEGDWPAFWRLARATRASGEDLMAVIQAAMEYQTARPTPAPPGSPSPGGSTSLKSREPSPSRGPSLPAAFADLPDGRPDRHSGCSALTGLSPRLFLNVVYAWLAARCPDDDARKKLDEELHAPAGGWDAAERNLWTAIMNAPDPGRG